VGLKTSLTTKQIEFDLKTGGGKKQRGILTAAFVRQEKKTGGTVNKEQECTYSLSKFLFSFPPSITLSFR
jgi:hypothetical protein